MPLPCLLDSNGTGQGLDAALLGGSIERALPLILQLAHQGDLLGVGLSLLDLGLGLPLLPIEQLDSGLELGQVVLLLAPGLRQPFLDAAPGLSRWGLKR